MTTAGIPRGVHNDNMLNGTNFVIHKLQPIDKTSKSKIAASTVTVQLIYVNTLQWSSNQDQMKFDGMQLS